MTLIFFFPKFFFLGGVVILHPPLDEIVRDSTITSVLDLGPVSIPKERKEGDKNKRMEGEREGKKKKLG